MIVCYPKYMCLHIGAKELKKKYCSSVLAALSPGTKLLTTFLHCGVSTTLELVGTHCSFEPYIFLINFHKIIYYFPEDFQKISCYFPEVVKNKGTLISLTLKDGKMKMFCLFLFSQRNERPGIIWLNLYNVC